MEDLLRPGALFEGRFRIERAFGEGGMGKVWAAIDTRLERAVAIKVMHATLSTDRRYAERFLREMKGVARLSHPSVVPLYDAGAAAERVEDRFARAEDLAEALRGVAKSVTEAAGSITREVGRAAVDPALAATEPARAGAVWGMVAAALLGWVISGGWKP